MEVGKSKRRRNQTAHERAMTDPKVREAVSNLKSDWDLLSPLQRGKQLNKLVDLTCSERGLAEELRKPPTTIRRYMELAASSESRSDSKAEMGDANAKKTKVQSATNALESARESKPLFQKTGTRGAAIKISSQAKATQINPKIQSAKGIAHTASIAPKQPPTVKGVVKKQEEPTRQIVGETSLVDQYLRMKGIITPEQRRQLVEDEKKRKRRLLGSARLMKRQGLPLPPEDVS
jgi:hypothetical protein